MIEQLKALVLRMAKVPPEPHPPVGSEGSVTIFRASKRFFQLNLVRWALAQISTLIGIVVALTFLRAGAFGVETVLDRLPYEDLTMSLFTARRNSRHRLFRDPNPDFFLSGAPGLGTSMVHRDGSQPENP